MNTYRFEESRKSAVLTQTTTEKNPLKKKKANSVRFLRLPGASYSIPFCYLFHPLCLFGFKWRPSCCIRNRLADLHVIGTSFRPEEKPMENDRVDCQLISIANDISIGGKYLICILENEWSREDEGGGSFLLGPFSFACASPEVFALCLNFAILFYH